MASSKETPRQRMVGMMYLVLTALLALQVSSAMIFKFQALNESLEKSSKDMSRWNEKKLAKISDEVKKRGSKEKEVKLLQAAQRISAGSKEMTGYIETIKKDLIRETGGYDSDGSLKGAKEDTKVEVMMIGAAKSGRAYALKKRLEDYVRFMNMHSGMRFGIMALDGTEDPLFKDNEEQRNKDFAELNFGQTPLVAALAILSEFQSRIATMEATTVTALSEKIKMDDYAFDVVQPMVSPVSKVVAAGTRYEAKLFMTATSSAVKPQMQLGSADIKVDDNGVGSVSFVAPGGGYVNGMARKTWTGKITMKTPAGKDTTYIISEEYLVAQPVIKTESDAVKALYRNCGNKLNIQVPALGNAYNPKITADGAVVIPGEGKGRVTVVPTGASVSLKVSSDGNYIGEEKYRVRLIPLPAIEVKANGARIDPVKGVEAALLRSIELKVIPDKDFAEFLPDEKIYIISRAKVRIARNRQGLSPREYNSGNINLGSMAQDLKPNDKLIVEVLEIKRKNFKGEWEMVKMPEAQTTFIIPVN